LNLPREICSVSRVRTRSHGGVAGVGRRLPPYADQVADPYL
jgi:hypothetical protein